METRKGIGRSIYYLSMETRKGIGRSIYCLSMETRKGIGRSIYCLSMEISICGSISTPRVLQIRGFKVA